MSHIKYESRYASSPNDVKQYDTQQLRDAFLIQNLFEKDMINMTYTHYDRFIAGGALPISKSLSLDPIDPLKADYFLERRELGVFNIGNPGKVSVDGKDYDLDYKDALYVGKGKKSVILHSKDKNKPAKFYFGSAPAHNEHPTNKVTLADAEVLELGDPNASNERKLNKMIVSTIIPCDQLQMGITELSQGSIWNTMPPHTHDRRMEVYFYFDLPNEHTLCHFMGQPDETRHIFLHNEQAVISPNWSIHAGAGTANYSFVWGMAGENMAFDDMDKCSLKELK